MTSIFHITPHDNLQSIIAHGGLYCDKDMESNQIVVRNIAYGSIKQRRLVTAVPVGPRGVIADYAPFYFCPRSPMLLTIHSGNVHGYSGGQWPFVHLVAEAENVVSASIPFAFTDGHAIMQITRFFDNLEYLHQLDWDVIPARMWKDTISDPDRMRKKQAEFLVYRKMPWNLISIIGVIDNEMSYVVKESISECDHKPDVVIRRDWYY